MDGLQPRDSRVRLSRIQTRHRLWCGPPTALRFEIGHLSAGSGAVAVNATGFGNVITNTVNAVIEGGSTVTADDLVDLTAMDQSMIRSLGISVAGTGGVAVGALIGANVITNAVAAEISGSTVNAGSTLNLAAQSDADILGFTAGVAASGAGSGVLSLSANVITNTTNAAIVNDDHFPGHRRTT